jgi:hypothetical protein
MSVEMVLERDFAESGMEVIVCNSVECKEVGLAMKKSASAVKHTNSKLRQYLATFKSGLSFTGCGTVFKDGSILF